jgi:excinuclease UvrABC nuclease subunit
MADIAGLPEICELQRTSMPLIGNCSGVYFLFHEETLVYVGQGWNCLLRVAEHTRKDSDKIFTSWSYIPVDGEQERKELESQLRATLKPKYNKI